MRVVNIGTTRREEPTEHPYGWVIVAVSTVCLALGFGANVTVSVFIAPLEEEFGWARGDIALAYTVLTVGAALGGIFWGTLSDRIGTRWIGVFGAVAISAALASLSWQSELWAIYAIYFLIGALGFACLFTPMLALTGMWFDKRKGLALGIVTAGGAIGQGLVPFIARLLISAVGWRDAALYLGIGYFLHLMPLMVLLKPPVHAKATGRVDRPDENQWGLPHQVTIPWLALAGVFCCICMAVPIVHLVPLGTDLGLSPELAAGMLLALMSAGVVGRLFFGALADRVGGLYAYFAASLAQTTVVFFFTQTSWLPLLFALAVWFGFGFSGVMTGLIICAREAAPLRITGFAIAVVTTTAWIGMGIGAYQGGYFYDASGDYVISYGFAAGSGILNLTIVAALIAYSRAHAAGRLFAS